MRYANFRLHLCPSESICGSNTWFRLPAADRDECFVVPRFAMATDISSTTFVRRRPRRPAELRPVDEHANLITHGFGLVLSLVASGLLMTVVVQTRSPT